MMNLQVQVAASLCLVLLVIQPALNEPIKSFKELSYDETEHERAHANIRIVEREVIKKSPTCDCHSKITKLPAVTIHQAGVPAFHQPIDDDDDIPTSLRLKDEDSDDVGEQELLLRRIYKKFGKNAPSLGPLPDKPIINRQLARLQKIRESDIDDDEVPDHLSRLYQNDQKLNGKDLLLRKLYEKYADNAPSFGPLPDKPVINRRLARLQKIRESEIDADELPAHLRLLYQNDEKLNEEELLLRKLCKKYNGNIPSCGSRLPQEDKW